MGNSRESMRLSALRTGIQLAYGSVTQEALVASV